MSEIKHPNISDTYRHIGGGGLYKVLLIANEATATGNPGRYPVSVIYQDVEDHVIRSYPLDQWWDNFCMNDPVKHLIGNVRECLKDWLPDNSPEIPALVMELRQVIYLLQWLPEYLPQEKKHGAMADNYRAAGWNECINTIALHRNQLQEKQ